jgi:hypothetical protein
MPDGVPGELIERGPFYARFLGQSIMAERIDFARWSSPFVRAMIHARLARRDA